ncbi:hypothetical protein AOX59_13745 [Lentibacillus amyloliquefaciens]|uniref:Uncharacterized protein n=1 Tax=Lentibacillus amyloliquefaciens TaxID=1472767 RepID=A0A0U3W8V9_9BACI|nr:hypothetical protein AOX59_13745 [Lentibacillus amyloliquefaciens]
MPLFPQESGVYFLRSKRLSVALLDIFISTPRNHGEAGICETPVGQRAFVDPAWPASEEDRGELTQKLSNSELRRQRAFPNNQIRLYVAV